MPLISDTATDTEDDRICVSPGQVVEADILDKILKQPDHCRIFYGPGNTFITTNVLISSVYIATGIKSKVLEGFWNVTPPFIFFSLFLGRQTLLYVFRNLSKQRGETPFIHSSSFRALYQRNKF